MTMTKTGCARVALCLLAMVLLNAAAPRIGRTEEAAANVDHPAAADSKGGQGEDTKRDGGGARSVDPPSSRVEGSDPIDTRNSVPPHHSAFRRDDGKDVRNNLRFFAPTSRMHRFSRTESHDASRNAIGMSISRDDHVRRDGRHPDLLGAPHELAARTSAIDGSSSGRTKTEDHMDRPVLSAKPIVRLLAPTHGVINGTGVVQRGSGPSRIGGPAAAVAGINGTTIRPKY